MKKTICTIVAAAMTAAATESCVSSKNQPAKNADTAISSSMAAESLDGLNFSDAHRMALQGINDFGISLMRTQTGMDSKVVSPLSVSFLMGMLANGAAGDTRTEIARTLGVEKVGLDVLNETCKALMKTAANKSGKLTISIADCIAVDNNISLEKSYVDQMMALYGAQVVSRDFTKSSTLKYINDWCSSHTGGMIPRIIETLSPNDKAVLMNAVYFNGSWQDKFDKSNTREENFRGYTRDIKKAKMMHDNGKRMYAEMHGYRAVNLPYAGNEYQMTIILPNEDRSVADVLETLNANMIDSLQRSMDECQVDLAVPRFAISTKTLLNDPVSQLGSPSMFQSGKADFSKMTQQPLFVSTMLQKARIEVTEEGTKAAAVTTAQMMATSLMPDEPRCVEFHADRPFVYMITHCATGAIFFIGQYTGDNL